jgi:hypothetical protein
VASVAVHDLAHRRPCFQNERQILLDASDVSLVACGAVALGTAGRDLFGIVFVPVVKGFCRLVGVR